MKYLFDTRALLAYFNNEEGANFVEEIIENNSELYISSITLTEIYYIYSRRVDEEAAEERVDQLRYNLEVVGIKDKEAIKAGKYKENDIPIADALIGACAESVNASVVTSDEHFEDIDIEVVDYRVQNR